MYTFTDRIAPESSIIQSKYKKKNKMSDMSYYVGKFDLTYVYVSNPMYEESAEKYMKELRATILILVGTDVLAALKQRNRIIYIHFIPTKRLCQKQKCFSGNKLAGLHLLEIK